jgi:hypothetical protein
MVSPLAQVPNQEQESAPEDLEAIQAQYCRKSETFSETSCAKRCLYDIVVNGDIELCWH